MYASNEELLRDGECSSSNCIEDIGHLGPHSYEMDPHIKCSVNAPCGMEASDGKNHGTCVAKRP